MPTDTSLRYGLRAPTQADPEALGGQRIRDLRDDVEAALAAHWKTRRWVPYTPTLTGIALGNGALAAAYTIDGPTCHARLTLTAGTTTTFTGTLGFGLPVAARAGAYPTGAPLGAAFLLDASAGTPSRLAGIAARNNDQSVFILSARDTNATVTATAPWTWATGDQCHLTFAYEVDP